MKFNSLQEAYEALDILQEYIHARIEANNFRDMWYPSFEEYYQYKRAANIVRVEASLRGNPVHVLEINKPERDRFQRDYLHRHFSGFEIVPAPDFIYVDGVSEAIQIQNRGRIRRVDATASFGLENTDKKPAKRIGWYDATAFVLLLASLAFLIYVLIFTL